MTESAKTSKRRPQWLGERKAVLVRMPIELAEQLRDAARVERRSVSQHAAWLLSQAMDEARS